MVVTREDLGIFARCLMIGAHFSFNCSSKRRLVVCIITRVAESKAVLTE